MKWLLFVSLFGSIFQVRANSHDGTSVNAIIGDTSWYQLHSNRSLALATNHERITTHLEYMVLRLKAHKPNIAAPEWERRQACIQLLEEYVHAASYPRNSAFPERRQPCFIDASGNLCAVGCLLANTSGLSAAQAVNNLYQYHYLLDMPDPGLSAWAKSHGFTLRELAMIQPTYGFEDLVVSKFASRIYFDSTVNRYGLTDQAGKKLGKPKYQQIQVLSISGELALAKVDDFWGVIDFKGNWVQEPIYDEMVEHELDLYRQQGFIFAYKQDEITILNTEAIPINPERYTAAATSGNYLLVEQAQKWGVLHYGGAYLLKPKYQSIQYFHNMSGFKVRGTKGYGVVNTAGERLIPLNHTAIEELKGIWLASKSSELCLYNVHGTESQIKGIESCLLYGSGYRENSVLCKMDGQYGLMGNDLNWVISPAFDTIYRHHHYHIVKQNGKMGLYQLNGAEAIQPLYTSLEPTGTNVLAKQDGKTGMIGESFETIIPVQYDSIMRIGCDITQGRYQCYAIGKPGSWQLVNHLGEQNPLDTFDEIIRIDLRQFAVRKDQQYFFGAYFENNVIINKGHPFDELGYLQDSFCFYRDGEGYGLLQMNRQNVQSPFTLTTKAIFDKVPQAGNLQTGYYVVVQNGLYGLISGQGNSSGPFMFSDYRWHEGAISVGVNMVYMLADDSWYKVYINGAVVPLPENTTPPAN